MGYVLVVEDDESIRDVIALILSDEGYDVACARSGDDGLRVIRERPPALILVDLLMPDQSGEEFIRACRRLPHGVGPTILVSGHPDLELVAAEVGADHFLSKPFELTDLLDAVQAALASRDVA
jgi:DNA-binding response OmpR family regulator